jgi:hypothetical protein
VVSSMLATKHYQLPVHTVWNDIWKHEVSSWPRHHGTFCQGFIGTAAHVFTTWVFATVCIPVL